LPLNAAPELAGDEERQRFVIKVYAICAFQVLITTAFVLVVMNNPKLKKWVGTNYWLQIVCFALALSAMVFVMCAKQAARKIPLNYILLTAFTLLWSYAIAAICGEYEAKVVLIAAVCTLAMFCGLTGMACFVRVEKLNFCWGLLGAVSCLIIPGILFLVFFRSFMIHTAVILLFVVLLGCYIVYDTKLIMVALSVDDYVIGSMLIYMDIVNLFLCLLSLFGNSN
jgi:protein lifeguard